MDFDRIIFFSPRHMKTYSNDYSDNDEDCSCSSCECSSSKSFGHSGMNIEHIYQIIDRSYTKIPSILKNEYSFLNI
jgi:hypothetical protein